MKKKVSYLLEGGSTQQETNLVKFISGFVNQK